MAVSRLTNGLTIHGRTDPWHDFGGPMWHRKFYAIFEDFYYDPSDTDGWSSATAANDTITMGTASGGNIRLFISGKDNNVIFMQGATMTFKMVSGKKTWFGARLRHNIVSGKSSGASMDWIFGLAIGDTAPIASTPTDQVTLRCDDGDLNVDFRATKGGTAGLSASAVTTTTANTWERYDVYFDGVQTFEIYKDGVKVSTQTTSSFPVVGVAPIIAIQAGTASDMWMDVDYLYAIQER